MKKKLTKKQGAKLLRALGTKEKIAIELGVCARQVENYLNQKTPVPVLRMEKIESILNKM